MKKTCSVLLVLVMVMMVISCASTGSSGGTTASIPANMPPWINERPPADAMYGVGSDKKADLSFAMQSAENRGRVAIARQLNTKVEAMFIDYNLAAGPAGNQATTSLQENVSRSVTRMDVSGAIPDQTWTAPDGTVWVRMIMMKGDARNQVASILRNEEAAYAQFKAQQALDMLDKRLAIDEPPLYVTE